MNQVYISKADAKLLQVIFRILEGSMRFRKASTKDRRGQTINAVTRRLNEFIFERLHDITLHSYEITKDKADDVICVQIDIDRSGDKPDILKMRLAGTRHVAYVNGKQSWHIHTVRFYPTEEQEKLFTNFPTEYDLVQDDLR